MLVLYFIEYKNSVKFFYNEKSLEIPKNIVLDFGKALKKRAKKEHIKIQLKNLL